MIFRSQPLLGEQVYGLPLPPISSGDPPLSVRTERMLVVSGDLIQQLLNELAAERALADQLASHLEWALRCVGSLPMEMRTTFDNRMAEVLAAHKEARRG